MLEQIITFIKIFRWQFIVGVLLSAFGFYTSGWIAAIILFFLPLGFTFAVFYHVLRNWR